MHRTTIEIIHWIWGEPELADLLRDTAQGNEFDYGDEEMMGLIASFVFPTEGRKTPAGRLEWLSEAEPELIRDALLGADGMSEIYVHATTGRYSTRNRYLVRDSGTVAESGWTATSGMWGLAEKDRQVCPEPIGSPCSCEVTVRGE